MNLDHVIQWQYAQQGYTMVNKWTWTMLYNGNMLNWSISVSMFAHVVLHYYNINIWKRLKCTYICDRLILNVALWQIMLYNLPKNGMVIEYMTYFGDIKIFKNCFCIIWDNVNMPFLWHWSSSLIANTVSGGLLHVLIVLLKQCYKSLAACQFYHYYGNLLL